MEFPAVIRVPIAALSVGYIELLNEGFASDKLMKFPGVPPNVTVSNLSINSFLCTRSISVNFFRINK